MRNLTDVLVAAALLIGWPISAQSPADLVNARFSARVVAVVDGDTIEIATPRSGKLRVRLHGVDTPERGEPFSQAAGDFTRVMMFDREVQLVGQNVDVYGRLVARVTVDRRDASEAVIAAGLGCTFRRYVSDATLDAAQKRAQAARSGFWASGARQPACVAREARALSPPVSRAGLPNGYVGNVSSKLYHALTCKNAHCKSCTIRFGSSREAELQGFRPAGDCLE